MDLAVSVSTTDSGRPLLHVQPFDPATGELGGARAVLPERLGLVPGGAAVWAYGYLQAFALRRALAGTDGEEVRPRNLKELARRAGVGLGRCPYGPGGDLAAWVARGAARLCALRGAPVPETGATPETPAEGSQEVDSAVEE